MSENQLVVVDETVALETGEPADKGVRGAINIAGDTVTLNTAWMPETERALVRWLYNWIQESNLTWKEVERETGMDSSTVYRVLHDRYRYPLLVIDKKTNKKIPHPRGGERVDVGAICERIARLKKLFSDRETTADVVFIETSVYKRIAHLCKEALVMQCFGFIYGESQIGKTHSLREVQRRNNHGQTKYVLTPAAAGKLEMMQEMARACHIGTRKSFAEMRSRVTHHFDGTMLLILDEVHEFMQSYQSKAMLACLGFLRQIQETTQCGMVLSGTNAFRNEIESGEFKQALKQLRKRGILELQLEDYPTNADLQLIADAYHLPKPTGDAAEHVKWVGRDHGLGKYCKFLRRASQLAAKKSEKMSWGHFVTIIAVAEELKRKPEGK